MSEQCRALFGCNEEVMAFRFEGVVRYTIAVALDSFVERALAECSSTTIVIDLNDAKHVDSTTLGLLSRIGAFSLKRLGRRAVAMCRRGDIDSSLRAVAFDEVFVITHEPGLELPKLEEIAFANPQASDAQVLGGVIADAHRDLMALSDANRASFGDVVKRLENELNAKRNGALRT